MDTSSWRELDAGWRDRLAWLHDDYFFRRQDALWRANALRTLPVRGSRSTESSACCALASKRGGRVRWRAPPRQPWCFQLGHPPSRQRRWDETDTSRD